MCCKMLPKRLAPIHPGEQLADILSEAGLTANALALQIRVPSNRITAIINGKRNITVDTALPLGKFFGTSAQFWVNLQTKYDLDTATDDTAEANYQSRALLSYTRSSPSNSH
jgi:antitoxin HigA-1